MELGKNREKTAKEQGEIAQIAHLKKRVNKVSFSALFGQKANAEKRQRKSYKVDT